MEMEQEQFKELIRKNYTNLIRHFSDKIENVCTFLLEKNVISGKMKERVLSKPTPSRKSEYLLDLIPNRGDRAFPALYEASKLNGLIKAADILRPDKAPHRKISSKTDSIVVSTQEEQWLPDKWPTEEHYLRVMDKKLDVRTVTRQSNPEMMKIYETHLNHKQTIYPMCQRPRGKALIIVNETFFQGFDQKPRLGSKMDKRGLKQLFNGLGFKVEVKNNLKKCSINDAIQAEMDADHSQHDCFVFYIGSYGGQGVVYDTMKEAISLRSIIDRFNEVEDLKNKPKLFFFQACQGAGEDEGHYVSAGVAPTDCEDEDLEKHDGGDVTGEDLTIPVYRDVFVIRSSPDGLRSVRNTESGSWFTQAIIYIFSEYAYTCEFHDLFLKVNQLLAKAETKDTRYKNIAELKSIIGRKLYFFPGLCDER